MENDEDERLLATLTTFINERRMPPNAE